MVRVGDNNNDNNPLSKLAAAVVSYESEPEILFELGGGGG